MRRKKRKMRRKERKVSPKRYPWFRYQTKIYNAQFDSKFLEISKVTNPLVPVDVIKEIKEEDIKREGQKVYTIEPNASAVYKK